MWVCFYIVFSPAFVYCFTCVSVTGHVWRILCIANTGPKGLKPWYITCIQRVCKGTVFPSRDGCTTPLILNLALGGVPWTLFSRGQSARHTLNRLVGPQNLYWCFGEELNILPLTGIEPRFLTSVFHSVVTTLDEWTVSPYEIIWNLMQQGNFINVFLARHVSGTYAHHQEH